jgi:hypothetical protein
VIAPASMDALADVARALGFELRRAEHAKPLGVDYDRAQEQTQFALFRGDQIEFDGTARECSAFLIGWRDLRSSVLGAVRAIDAQVMPEMSAVTRCQARDDRGNRCLLRAGHDGLKHARLAHWEETPGGEL